VMYSEDAGFYSHKGFYLRAFRESIVQNFKKGKFARGGSTISMQLVKNVFLNHRKTLTRKAEEIFITWIIENKKITSKKRMMEVYLNVIEFGNNIWGIGEASRYYFGKHPSQLTNKECVFIASLVPRPRVYQNLIQSDGTVSPNNWNFTAIQNRFLGKGILSKDDTSRLLPTLRFKLRQNLAPEIEEENPDQINLEIFE
ncbi:MAG: biosynthetic peptidoglycan transglycosylase, partial [Bacteroidota bacterium]